MVQDTPCLIIVHKNNKTLLLSSEDCKLFVVRYTLSCKILFTDTATLRSLDTKHALANQLHMEKVENCIITIFLICYH